MACILAVRTRSSVNIEDVKVLQRVYKLLNYAGGGLSPRF